MAIVLDSEPTLYGIEAGWPDVAGNKVAVEVRWLGLAGGIRYFIKRRHEEIPETLTAGAFTTLITFGLEDAWTEAGFEYPPV